MARWSAAFLILSWEIPVGCDDGPDECDGEVGCERGADEGPVADAGGHPQSPSEPPWPAGPYCDATRLEGLQCDCGGLRIEVMTLGGELVSDGEASLILRRAGTGAFSVFGVCDDLYLWEDGDPSCALAVVRVDNGCSGLALRHVPEFGDAPGVTCPVIPANTYALTCEPAQR
jgi:hypothetical protein